jgi:hypothetical protein
MFFDRRILLLAVAALALSACKSGTQAGNSSNGQTPAQQSTTANPNDASGTQNGTGASAAGSTASPNGTQAQNTGPQQPPPPAFVDLPAGTQIRVRIDQDLGSKISQSGDSFPATVADNVLVNGQTVIARGARAEGTVVEAHPLGKIKGGASLALRLERVHTNWGSYPVASSTVDRAEKGKGKRTAEFAGGGAALGALIGGLAGHGKGAVIGGLAGGGAGLAGGAFTGNQQIVLPSETLLTFRLERTVHIQQQ